MDRLIDGCIQHLSRDSNRLFSIIKQNDADGVIWAVFTQQNGGNALTPRLKRSSFLPLSTVQSSKAQSLIQMFNSCNHNNQFVCWFTLEDAKGQPMASKVLIVDCGSGGGGGRSSRSPGATSAAASPGASRAGASGNRQAGGGSGGVGNGSFTDPSLWHNDDNTALSDLKEDMMAFQRQREGGGNLYEYSNTKSTAMAEEKQAFLAQFNASRTNQAKPSSKSQSNSNNNDPQAASGQYQQILKVSLQVADSVSKMGNAIDELQNRMDNMQRMMEERPAPSPETMERLLTRIEALEQRMDQQEARVAAFDGVQASFFEQLNSLRKQAPFLAHTHQQQQGSSGASGGGSTTPATRRLDMSRREPSASPSTSSTYPDHSVGAAEESRPTAASRSESTVSEQRPVGLFANRRAQKEGSESLSDMLKSMETRLSKIKTPT